VVCMTPSGVMNEAAGRFAGLDRYACREEVVKALEAEGLLAKVEAQTHQVGHHDRCGNIIEPYLSRQWFLRMDRLAEPAVKAVADGEVTLFPDRWVGVYDNWMNNIRDWCISRQLWWGHRIPVWYCDECGEEIAATETPTACPKCGASALHQDEDVLDTWFSSWLWTFSPLGWPDRTADLERFHPTSVLVTAADIIFFWVARMIMASYEFLGEKPFSEVLFTGIVRDEQGRKMSKSLGNSPDPIDLIDKYGADALRCSLVMLTPTGQDIFFTESTLEVGRNFCNKIFQATKLVLGAWDEAELPGRSDEPSTAPRVLDLQEALADQDWREHPGAWFSSLWKSVYGDEPPVAVADRDLQLADRWILSRLMQTVGDYQDAMEKRRLNDAAYGVFNFFRHEFCDWYLEAIKPRLRDPERRAAAEQVAVLQLGVAYKLLHPVMPFITEELWNWLPPARGFLMVSSLPENPGPAPFDTDRERFNQVMDIVTVVRNVRSELNVPPGKRGHVVLRVAEQERVSPLQEVAGDIALLAKLEDVTVVCGGPDPAPAGNGVCGTVEVFLLMAGLVDLAKERARLDKELAKIQGWIKGCEAKLANEKFTANAPVEVVRRQEELLRENRAQAETLVRRLEALGKD